MTMVNHTTILFSFLLGLAIGSFCNVCIHRVPRRQSLIKPSSQCPYCNEKVSFYDNIPIISYLVLLGRCRHCRKPISVRYPIVELMVGLISAALFIRHGVSCLYFFLFAFAAALVIISFIDLQHQIIPDVISLPGIFVGILFSLVCDLLSWHDSVLGILGGGGFLFLVAICFEKLTGKEGMGGGDIKLLAMIGAWLGWRTLPFIILMASLIGVVVGGGSLLLSRRGLRTKIPFGPFLALGSLMYLFFGNDIVGWYINFVVAP